MKKYLILMAIFFSCLLITGCGQKKDEESRVYYFTDNGNDFILGSVFDKDKLGENSGYSETVSCASLGTDKTYTYPHFEVKTYNDSKDDRIYSIWLTDDEVKTNEGIKVTDSYQDMINTYGNNFEKKDNLHIYTLGKTKLEFIVENDIIVSIEYVYDVEL